MDFMTLPTGDMTLANLHVPGCMLGQTGGLVLTDLGLSGGRVVAPGVGTTLDMRGAMALPTFVDMHTHLDKGHIWPRAANPDGTFMGAITTVAADRVANWQAEDVRRRIDFGLRCAFAHGTCAIRTHLDSAPPQDGISYHVFREIQQDWADRIALQASCLVAIDNITDGPPFSLTADLVAATPGGILGCVAYPVADVDRRLDIFLAHATRRGLDVDFHVDETENPASNALNAVARAVLRNGFPHRVTVGHCCSLAVQDEDEARETLDLVAEAGLHVVSLPMCNLYLQDRHPGQTPFWRGITLVHEMAAMGIPVSFASDNTRDPFYGYGDLDMVEVMREATRVAHLDHAGDDWPLSFSARPATACGFDAPSLMPGSPADLVIFKARGWTEFFSRPQSDRIVIRAGRAIDRTLPDYAELDDLMR